MAQSVSLFFLFYIHEHSSNSRTISLCSAVSSLCNSFGPDIIHSESTILVHSTQRIIQVGELVNSI
jgi:hypothetical protein